MLSDSLTSTGGKQNMAIARTIKRKFKHKKRISTDAITHSYAYR